MSKTTTNKLDIAVFIRIRGAKISAVPCVGICLLFSILGETLYDMTWQNQRVSVLAACTSTQPRTVTLSAWIQSTKTSKLTIDKCDRPALMPHGMFVGGRRLEHLHSTSSIVQFDIDLKHNPHLQHHQVKQRAAQCADIVFCARSAGGGLYGFARRRGDLDDQLNEIEQILGVVLDRCNSRSLAALRFASYDPQPYEHI